MTEDHHHTTDEHRTIFVVLTVALALVSALTAPPEMGLQLLIAVPLIAVLGVPHGALDFVLADAILGVRAPLWRRLTVLGGYTSLALGVVTLWWLSPVVALSAFLALSVYHFGSDDIVGATLHPAVRAAETVGRGLVVIAFPSAFHAEQVVDIFALLVQPEPARMLTAVCAGLAPLATLALAVSSARHLAVAGFRRRRRDLMAGLELLALGLLFALLPPLLSFTVYFCALHSLRHLVHKGRVLHRCGFPFRHQLIAATLGTLVTVFLGVLAYVVLGGAVGEVRAVVQVVFVGLAAVTLPHMVLVARFEARFGKTA
ncbi:MAG: Brp/Blh family beta-carotene 15,15'-dioxygenase [Gammaproteobacteria bacterium]|nr:Brp/Blh family beta-carotene 15,15'-dioxygenase [Gammaproteobacteria bacterium]